ncbi:MAG TPA: hypothetical protein VND93_28925 [Myxococcales bacterium]|nr:hypothetical protein [Myxococcales bacterium]
MRLWVKGMGLATSLGSLVHGCAAFRAGSRRPSVAPDQEVMSPGDEEPGPVTVLSLGASTYGFQGVGRLVAIASEAIQDLARRADLSGLGKRTGLYLALPDPDDRGFTTGKDLDHEDPDEPAERAVALAERVAIPALEAAGVPFWDGPTWVNHGGNAAFIQAVESAEEHLREGQVDGALVLAVDSYCSSQTLELLRRELLLKTPDTPTGIIPGEAAAAVWLEPAPRHAPQGPEPAVVLRSFALAAGDPSPHLQVQEAPVEDDEDQPPPRPKPPEGKTLARCVQTAVGALPPGAPAPLLVSDHDGQEFRAQEWGLMQVALVAADPRWAGSPHWMPATSFGSTGAASGAIGLAVAVRGLQRGYASAPSAVVLSTSERGERAALYVTPL